MPDKTYPKVVLNGTTYMDLTSDTISPETILEGYTAHDRTGKSITGTASLNDYVLKSGDTMTGNYIVQDTVNNTKLEFTADKIEFNILEPPSDTYVETLSIASNDHGGRDINFDVKYYDDNGDVDETFYEESHFNPYEILFYENYISDEEEIEHYSALNNNIFTLWNSNSDGRNEMSITSEGMDIRVNNVIQTAINASQLIINTHDILRLTPKLAQIFTTSIPANANLNSVDYLKVKQYFINTTNALTLTNCPTTSGFTMTVEAPVSSTYDNESVNRDEVRRIRKITDLLGNQWIQACYRYAYSSTWTYGSWKQIVPVEDLSSHDVITGSGGGIIRAPLYFQTTYYYEHNIQEGIFIDLPDMTFIGHEESNNQNISYTANIFYKEIYVRGHNYDNNPWVNMTTIHSDEIKVDHSDSNNGNKTATLNADKLLMQKPRNSISSDPTMETVVIRGDDYKFATYVPVDGNAYIGENVSTITVLDETAITDEGQSEEVTSDMAGFKFTKSGCTYKYTEDNYTETENLESISKLYNGIIENGMFLPDSFSYMYYSPNDSQSREVNFLEISNKYNDITTETWNEDSVVCQETDDIKNTVECYLGTTYVSRKNPTQIRKLEGLKILHGHHSDYSYTEDGTIESEDTEESFYGSYLTYRSLAFIISSNKSEDTDDDWEYATIFHTGGFNIKTSNPRCIVNEEDIIANRPSFVRNNSGNIPSSLDLTSFYYKRLRQYDFNYTESSNRTGKPDGLNSSFIMQNYSPEYINSSSSSNTSYNIIRKIIASSGDEWIQPISYANGTYTDGAWKRILTDSDLFTQSLGSKNIANRNLFVQGSLTGAAGADTFGTTRLRSLFIPVKTSTTYSISTGNSVLIYEVHEYTSAKVFIQYTSKNQTSTTISTTATTGYIRLLLKKSDDSQINLSDLGNIQMNEGSTLASYTPYMPNSDEIVDYHQYATNLVPRLAQDLSFTIVANSNLNTLPYLRPGQYYCATDVNATSLTNSPTTDSFTMTVSVPTRETFEDDATVAYVSRVREITTWKGAKYIQSCYTQGTAGSYTFGAWNKVITNGDNCVEDLSSQLTNKASWVSDAKLLRYGRYYDLRITITASTPTSDWVSALSIPTSYAPADTQVAGNVSYGNYANIGKAISILVSQTVQIRLVTSMSSSNNYAIISASWIR